MGRICLLQQREKIETWTLCVKGFWYFEIKLPTTQVYADTFYGSKTVLFKTGIIHFERPAFIGKYFQICLKCLILKINKHETKTVNIWTHQLRTEDKVNQAI